MSGPKIVERIWETRLVIEHFQDDQWVAWQTLDPRLVIEQARTYFEVTQADNPTLVLRLAEYVTEGKRTCEVLEP